MNIWHDTLDAPRTPRRVSPGQDVAVIIGTWPIGPGQSVWVTWRRVTANAVMTEGDVAEWQRNTDGNSYWMARLAPFAEGEHVRLSPAVANPRDAGHVSDSGRGLRRACTARRGRRAGAVRSGVGRVRRPDTGVYPSD